MSDPEAPRPDAEFEIDELEHQALDLLDELRCGTAWIAAQTAQDEVSDDTGALDGGPGGRTPTSLEAAIIEAGEQPSRVAEAQPMVAALLLRLVSEIATILLGAARALAQSESRGAISTEQITRVETLLNESPELAAAIAPAIETTGMILGLDRSSIAWALLISLGERADASAPAVVSDCSGAIAERLGVALLTGGPAATAIELRVFRSAAVVAAGPSVRARVLATEHPQLLALATQLVERERDPAELVAAFDAAQLALASTSDGAQASSSSEPNTDGPKRRFTWVHLVLALIVLGLTLWHYLWR